MITKLASSYFTGVSEVFTSRSVKGFRSAILTVKAVEGVSFQIGAYQTFDGTNPSAQSQRAYFYKDGVKQEGNVTINTAGIYTFVVDFDGATNLTIARSGNTGDSAFSLNLRQNSISTSENFLKDIIAINEDILEEAQTKGYDVCIPLQWTTWTDVHKYNSARLIVKGISSYISIYGTINPSADKPSELNENIKFFFGSLQVNILTPTVNTVDIDIKDANVLKIGTSNVESQTLDAYLLLSTRELVFDNKEITVNRNINLGTSKVNSLDVQVTVDGLTEGSSNAIIRITDNANNPIDYAINDLVVSKDVVVSEAKTYSILVDCKDLDGISINGYRMSGFTLKVLPSESILDISDIATNILSKSRSYIFSGMKQLEIETEGNSINIPMYIEGSNDGFTTTTAIPFINLTTNSNVTFNYITSGTTRYFANVEGYNECRVRCVNNAQYIYGSKQSIINITPHKEYKEILTIPYCGLYATNHFKGYKYAKVLFKSSLIINGNINYPDVHDCSASLIFRNLTTGNKYYDLGMNPISPLVYEKTRTGMFPIFGNAVDGGFIIEFPEPISIETYPYLTMQFSRTGYSAKAMFEVELSVNKPEPKEQLEKVYDKEDYTVYKLPSDSVKRDVLNNDILEWEDNTLYFWHGGYNGVKYEIPFGADNVKNYVTGEKINFAYLLPFDGNTSRNGSVGITYKPSRIVVFTNSRVYHNYPQRASNSGADSTITDIGLFDESSIITRKSWQPVNDKTKVDSKHKYFPVLAEYDYSQFDGRVAGTTGFVDTYSNGGLVNYNNRLWLDIPIDGVAYWNRLTYSNMAKGEKWCVFGNYNTIPGSEPIVMATNDGGRTWHVKAYFGCTDFYNYLYGSKIDLKPITDVASYVSGSMRMCRRRFNVPTPETKEPNVPFVIEAEDKSLVTSFTTDTDGDVLVTLEDNVDYDGKYPVVYFENVSANSEWNYICNTGFTADGTTTNSGIFFRVKKVTANTYKLFGDLGNQYEGDMVCRHIHAVNAVESGFLISTGESYCPDHFEGGFIYHLEQNEKNGGSIISPADVNNKVLRLCSSYMGVNRASGAYLFSDNYDPTLLYVSDEAFTVSNSPVKTEKRYASIPGRTGKVPVTPGGIFVGKLSDIDDQSKFKCVCELHTTIVGLTQTHGHFAADGHENAIMFSKDGFNWNIDVDDNSKVNGTDNYGNIYFGNKVVVFK